jgi:hypothetical protein
MIAGTGYSTVLELRIQRIAYSTGLEKKYRGQHVGRRVAHTHQIACDKGSWILRNQRL